MFQTFTFKNMHVCPLNTLCRCVDLCSTGIYLFAGYSHYAGYAMQAVFMPVDAVLTREFCGSSHLASR